MELERSNRFPSTSPVLPEPPATDELEATRQRTERLLNHADQLMQRTASSFHQQELQLQQLQQQGAQ